MLHDLGQSLWLDNITRDLLDSGTLARYIAELSVTGLTSNPTIYDKAIGGGSSYDADVRADAAEQLFSCICHQGDVYEATAYVIPFLLRLLA